MDVGCLYWWKILFGHYYANLALHMYVYFFYYGKSNMNLDYSELEVHRCL